MLKRFARDRRGATAIEYSLIAGLVGLVIIAAVGSVGVTLDGIFVAVQSGFSGAP